MKTVSVKLRPSSIPLVPLSYTSQFFFKSGLVLFSLDSVLQEVCTVAIGGKGYFSSPLKANVKINAINHKAVIKL